MENSPIVFVMLCDLLLAIKSSDFPRARWGEALQKMSKNGDDQLLDLADMENSWDNEEWEW